MRVHALPLALISIHRYMDIVCVACLRTRAQVIDWNSVEECVLQAGQVAGRRELVLGSGHDMPSFCPYASNRILHLTSDYLNASLSLSLCLCVCLSFLHMCSKIYMQMIEGTRQRNTAEAEGHAVIRDCQALGSPIFYVCLHILCVNSRSAPPSPLPPFPIYAYASRNICMHLGRIILVCADAKLAREALSCVRVGSPDEWAMAAATGTRNQIDDNVWKMSLSLL